MSQGGSSNRLIAGKYLTREQIGVGGAGVVYRGEELSTGRSVAIKLLTRCQNDTPSGLANEAKMLEEIAHPGVVRALAHGVQGELDYLVMEFLPGRTLRQIILAESPLPINRALALFRPLATAVSALHARGFVHADLKSDNVMVDEHDRVTLIDFGLAHRQSGRHPTGQTWGTPEYIAPELVLGEAPSVTSDSYALGVILYELCAGSTPFGGGDAAEILDRQLYDMPERPSQRCPVRPIPRALESVILRALRKAPAQRYADVAHLLAAAIPPQQPRLERIREAVRRVTAGAPRRRLSMA